MADYYLEVTDSPDPAQMDQIFNLWGSDERPKVAAVDFAYAFGTLLGDFLQHHLDFDWLIVIDDQGEDFCLKSGNGWETYPIQYVWKRVKPDGQDALNEDVSFFSGAWEMFSDRVAARPSQENHITD
jgi:hypothetical protein